jgi:hypothetical protein
LTPPANPKFTLSALTGKFIFNTTSPDVISLSASVPLPKGFSLSLLTGNFGGNVEFAMGNVIDTMTLSAAGKSTASARKRIKTFQLTLPKLPGDVANGGEIAKIKAQFSAAGLDTAGFNTDGITATRAPSEAGQKNLTRFIQVNMVLAGVAYESLIPVTYVLGTHDGFGTITGRH